VLDLAAAVGAPAPTPAGVEDGGGVGVGGHLLRVAAREEQEQDQEEDGREQECMARHGLRDIGELVASFGDSVWGVEWVDGWVGGCESIRDSASIQCKFGGINSIN
jgi:hypothetical protein